MNKSPFTKFFLFVAMSSASCGPADEAPTTTDDIRLNQLGYYNKASKVFVAVNTTSDVFTVVNETGQSVFEGKLNKPSNHEYVDGLKTGDFSALDKSGQYKIAIADKGLSYPFSVGPNVFDEVTNATVKAFYYQRASMDLEPQYAGRWARKAGHPDTQCGYRRVPGKTDTETQASPGGWYDAGDYGKYVVNGGISVATLMYLYEMYPNIIGDNLNIPESNNQRSDLLDEAKYELDWMNTMQDTDGGVYFKLATLEWPGFIPPEKDVAPRYIIGKSTGSTLNFAAVMAQAARVYQSYDKAFADRCVANAKKAWDWAYSNPDVARPTHPVVDSETGQCTDKGSGCYGDGDYWDEFLWTAAELYVTTREDQYKAFLLEGDKRNDTKLHALLESQVRGAPFWGDTNALGFFSLAVSDATLDPSISMLIESNIKNYADQVLSKIGSGPYRVPVANKDFGWGSNGTVANEGISLAYAYKLTGDPKYLAGIVDIADYVFGRNATGYSFVTAYGVRTPHHPHHRISGGDDVAEPVPGFVVGGPNGGHNDVVSNADYGDRVVYPSNEPSKSYVDMLQSYASNEIAINWNAPLVFVLGVLQANKQAFSQ